MNEDLSSFEKYLFVTLAQASVKSKKNGLTQEEFIKFCSDSWGMMEATGADALEKMLSDLVVEALRQVPNLNVLKVRNRCNVKPE